MAPPGNSAERGLKALVLAPKPLSMIIGYHLHLGSEYWGPLGPVPPCTNHGGIMLNPAGLCSVPDATLPNLFGFPI